MKPGPNLKQRSRGRNNNGGGKKHMSSRNQTYDSNGPDIRIRGNAHQVLEKYLTLARDAASQGDRIAAENYYQHAEHYFRVINSQNQANGRPNDRPLPTPADDQMAMAGEMDGDEEEGDEAEGEEAVVEQVTHRHQQHQQPAAESDETPQEAHAEEQPAAEAAPPRRRRPPRDRNRDHERSEEQPQGEIAEA